MRKLLPILLILIAGVAGWYLWKGKGKDKDKGPRPQPIAVSKHSPAFNQSIANFLNSYYALSEVLVNWDSTSIANQVQQLRSHFDSIRFEELKKDTGIYETAVSGIEHFKNDFTAISKGATLEEKRRGFNSLSQNTYALLQTIKFDGSKVYLQECPMAFNETESAIWLSKTNVIRNPYLGLHHPTYKAGMLQCGETKDTLNFTAVK